MRIYKFNPYFSYYAVFCVETISLFLFRRLLRLCLTSHHYNNNDLSDNELTVTISSLHGNHTIEIEITQ